MKACNKKNVLIVFCAFLMILTGCGDWSLSYSETVEYEGWETALDRKGKKAFVSCYEWDGSDEGRRIVIPDEVEGCKVYKLGGYFGRGYPMPFYLEIPYKSLGQWKQEGGEDLEPEELVFTLVIGKNLREIENSTHTADFVMERPDGTVKAFRIVFYMEVSEENGIFYAEDGKLYKKSDHSQVMLDNEWLLEKGY